MVRDISNKKSSKNSKTRTNTSISSEAIADRQTDKAYRIDSHWLKEFQMVSGSLAVIGLDGLSILTAPK